jgi:hypothetical protein
MLRFLDKNNDRKVSEEVCGRQEGYGVQKHLPQSAAANPYNRLVICT